MTHLEVLKEIARRTQGYIDRGEPLPMEVQPVLMQLLVSCVNLIEDLPADVVAATLGYDLNTEKTRGGD